MLVKVVLIDPDYKATGYRQASEQAEDAHLTWAYQLRGGGTFRLCKS
jgi:hypothetical protein